MEYILRARKYKKIYLPYYTCDSILSPVKTLGIEYEFYHIDKAFHIAGDINVGKDEMLLYTDYYGLMDDYSNEVAYNYSPNVVIDKTQAFFSKPRKHTDSFNSCRKYFGVSDGAYLFTDATLDMEIPQDYSTERMKAVLDRLDKPHGEAFSEYHKCEQTISESGMRRMSKLTQSIMESIDYNDAANRRLKNFYALDDALYDSNELHFQINYGTVPMVYPYLCHKEGLRQHLIKNHIYVAKYWPNVLEWVGDGSIESYFVEHLIPLPVDQRYGKEDMDYIIGTIKGFRSNMNLLK